MQKIDSHQHFWRYDPGKDSWITEEMTVIQKDFLPDDIYPVMQYNNITGCIAVQASQSEQENVFLLQLAAENPIIKGIVGWVDLMAENVESRLQYYRQFDKMKGFRHILEGEADDRLMLSKPFLHGISCLNQYGFTYDILIKPHQLIYANELVQAFPDQRFIVDHLGKPNIELKELLRWEKGIEAIAQHQHVHCKVSGFCTEANWYHWELKDVKPYLDITFQAFGSRRVMYGSDWPVCILAGGYNRMLQSLDEYTASLSEVNQALFWSKNAISFYQLNDSIK